MRVVDYEPFQGDVISIIDIASSLITSLSITHRSKLEALLETVKCHIISECSSDEMDAYLLRYMWQIT